MKKYNFSLKPVNKPKFEGGGVAFNRKFKINKHRVNIHLLKKCNIYSVYKKIYKKLNLSKNI